MQNIRQQTRSVSQEGNVCAADFFFLIRLKNQNEAVWFKVVTQ